MKTAWKTGCLEGFEAPKDADFLRFFSRTFYVSETETSAVVRVIRIGALAGTCSIQWRLDAKKPRCFTCLQAKTALISVRSPVSELVSVLFKGRSCFEKQDLEVYEGLLRDPRQVGLWMSWMSLDLFMLVTELPSG